MIKYYNRKNKSYEIEKVAGDKYLNWIYSSPIGMKLLEMIVKKKLFSGIYGFYVDRKSSRKKIGSFIKEFNLDSTSFEKAAEDFSSFNDFFYRKLKKEARPIDMDSNSLISLGDGKLLAYENIDLEKLIQVKGFTYSLKELIKDDATALKYEGGTCLILRLCPTDYHRFHFVDGGTCSKEVKIKGSYYSVNPIALDKVQKLFCENKREWSLLHSDNFKDILYVEVGATCVGAIVQSYEPNKRVEKGEEKGYFKFGGSTVIIFFEPNTIKIDREIINQTGLGFETSVLMGEKIGQKL
ncbi:phosphatidylserine decarboxylase [Candidatus Clostridium radicumherbarum]|uniref:Phosphatidylserine decarboxylase proenzyme n=1 Tax=Candidatus Clostridium radicumherbarum TaxID=3381662 RepID=A0ABW8TYT2_9CLOT